MARLLLAVFHKMTTGLRHSAAEPPYNLHADQFVDTMPKKKSPQLLSKVKNTGTATASESVSYLRPDIRGTHPFSGADHGRLTQTNGARPSTMYTWTDNTDKNLKPNKAKMTAFKNLTL